jgi:hypothetical protein
MTKFQLFSALVANGTAWITINGVTGILQSVTRESGSGSSFIVGMIVYTNERLLESKRVEICVRTID